MAKKHNKTTKSLGKTKDLVSTELTPALDWVYRLIPRYETKLIKSFWVECTDEEKDKIEQMSNKYEFVKNERPAPTDDMIVED